MFNKQISLSLLGALVLSTNALASTCPTGKDPATWCGGKCTETTADAVVCDFSAPGPARAAVVNAVSTNSTTIQVYGMAADGNEFCCEFAVTDDCASGAPYSVTVDIKGSSLYDDLMLQDPGHSLDLSCTTATVTGYGGNDNILGSRDADNTDNLYGSDGIDTIHGFDGDDYIHGGIGVDYLYGEDGEDTIYGADGDDYIEGGNDSDHIYGDGQIDTIYGGDGDDYIKGGTSGDTIYGEVGDDTICGESEDDDIDGGTGADTLYGGSGNPSYQTVYGGADTDYDTCGDLAHSTITACDTTGLSSCPF
jgi:Ca2+-binding RTX toxin-like protein